MNIEINGNNNRVAGRDYYESQIRVCPCCEQRHIDADRQQCRHCMAAQESKRAKDKLRIGGFFVLVCWGWLLTLREQDGLRPTPWDLADTFGGALGMVLVGYMLMQCVIYWMQSRN